jgi:hypothetical protein
MTAKTGAMDAGWAGPGSAPRRRDFKWSLLLWSLVFPARRERIVLTLPGLLLIALSLGIGSAAYNTANNILFIALSLLLSCLILSGVLSWLNFSGARWRLTTGPALRVGHDAAVALELCNTKKFLPTYGLWFELRAVAVRSTDSTGSPQANSGQARAVEEKEISKKSVREILAAVDKAEAQSRLFLRERLDAGEETRLEWISGRRGAARCGWSWPAWDRCFPLGF